MQSGGIIYLLCCIDNVRKAISVENPYILPASDIRYRTYVVSVLDESKKQELPGCENFFVWVLMGK
jgi:hypothetical protein